MGSSASGPRDGSGGGATRRSDEAEREREPARDVVARTGSERAGRLLAALGRNRQRAFVAIAVLDDAYVVRRRVSTESSTKNRFSFADFGSDVGRRCARSRTFGTQLRFVGKRGGREEADTKGGRKEGAIGHASKHVARSAL